MKDNILITERVIEIFHITLAGAIEALKNHPAYNEEKLYSVNASLKAGYWVFSELKPI